MIDKVLLRQITAFCLTLVAASAVMVFIHLGLGPALFFYVASSILLCVALKIFDPLGAGVFFVAAMTLGPFAGPVALIGASGSKKRKVHFISDARRYVPKDTRADLMFDEIVQGRRPQGRGNLELPFEEVFKSGTLKDQQTALAVIIRHYTADLRPALQCALASEIPAVRVQASSVFAHLRDTFALRARRLVKGEHALSADALENEIELVRTSGFLEPSELDVVPRPLQTRKSRNEVTV